MFRKVLVANRGEIAVRVMRACQELDVGTVAIYSDADARAGHVRYADEAYNVGPTSPAESYLDGESILEIAERAEAEAIHPGYGFLAENADFAALVEESDIAWVGPPSDVMRELGTKTGGRRTMAEADVPVVPGTTDPVSSADEVEAFADEHGYPIAIKADAGGGGRGMKLVESPAEIESQLDAAKREGDAYFDDETVYLERFLPSPKHIEVQVLADQHGNVRHLGERDCSLQRRQQKLIEEAPAPTLSDDRRTEIGEAARRGIEAAGYTNAGTVEFLVADDAFYFMEVNTRIQVEHPATELVTGIDIVKWQLRVAAGEQLPFAQSEIDERGHAIEYRINAENPADDFAPTPGVLATYDPPGGIGVRLDDAVRQGDEIGGEYDPLVAKVIVHASDREECLARSERALQEFEIDGVHTTIPFHRLMLSDEAFVEGTHTTDYLDEGFERDRLSPAVERWGPESFADGSVSAGSRRSYTVEVDGKRFDVAISDDDDATDDSATSQEPRSAPATAATSDTTAATSGEVAAEMEGTILSVDVAEGDEVDTGDVLCVLEAMKMENDIVATAAGTVTSVAVTEGDRVARGDVLVVID